MSLAVHTAPIDHARLYEDVETLLDRYSHMEMGQMNLGGMMEEMLSVANRHGLKMPEGMTMFSRGIMTLQGVVSGLDPEVDFVSIMAGTVKESVFQELVSSGNSKKGAHAVPFRRRRR